MKEPGGAISGTKESLSHYFYLETLMYLRHFTYSDSEKSVFYFYVCRASREIHMQMFSQLMKLQAGRLLASGY